MISGTVEEPYPSLGLLYLASTIRQEGFDVSYLDLPPLLKNHFSGQKPSWEEVDAWVEETLEAAMKDFGPDIVGVNCLFSGKFSGSVYVSQIIKKNDPGLPVVMGGYHPTVFHREILERIPSVDFVIIGEGEESFLTLLRSLFKGGDSPEGVDGLAFRSNSTVRISPKKGFIAELDQLPMPAWDLLDRQDYTIEARVWEKFWHNPKQLPLNTAGRYSPVEVAPINATSAVCISFMEKRSASDPPVISSMR
jgi:anaerobic magnesium-protoporphyrin IX monomethyl ester cyclase